jgi:transposase
VVDRDYNAAQNIRDEALRVRGVLGSGYLGTENWPVEGVSDCRKAAVLDEAGTTADLRVSAGTIG